MKHTWYFNTCCLCSAVFMHNFIMLCSLLQNVFSKIFKHNGKNVFFGQVCFNKHTSAFCRPVYDNPFNQLSCTQVLARKVIFGTMSLTTCALCLVLHGFPFYCFCTVLPSGVETERPSGIQQQKGAGVFECTAHNFVKAFLVTVRCTLVLNVIQQFCYITVEYCIDSLHTGLCFTAKKAVNNCCVK